MLKIMTTSILSASLLFFSACGSADKTVVDNVESITEVNLTDNTDNADNNVVISDLPDNTKDEIKEIIDDINVSDIKFTDIVKDLNISYDETQLLSLGDLNISIVLDKKIINNIPSGDIEGILLVSGENQEIAGSIFVTPIFYAAGSARDILNAYLGLLQSKLQNNATTQFTNISTQNNISNSVITSSVTAYYDVNLTSSAQPVELLNEIVKLIASNVENGEVNSSLVPLESSIATDSYRFGITVQYLEGKVLTRFAFVNRDNYIQYSDTISDIINPNNVKIPGLITERTTQTFIARDSNGTNQADFLFVIDNSGSMSSYQSSVSQAATDFASTLALSNLDYHIGIITTDSTYLHGNSFIDNNVSEFESRIIVGTSGSSTETGIYEAEESLKSLLLGDIEDGSSTLLGYPRADSHLNVIILSDEPSQYTSRASIEFDPYNNLFIDRKYTVYSIVNQDNDGQYVDLADATGGTSASINASEYSGLMENIAFNSGSVARGYKLAHKASIRTVSINGNNVPRSSVNGWSYNSGVNALLFDGNFTPNAGDEIVVDYTYTREANITTIALSIDAGVTVYTGDTINIRAIEGFEDGNRRDVLVNPEDLNVTSSNTTIISVFDGKIIATGEGSASVTVESKSGVQAVITVVTNGYRTVEFGSPLAATTLADNQILYYEVDVLSNGIMSIHFDADEYMYAYIYDENLSQLDATASYNFDLSRDVHAGRYFVGIQSYYGDTVNVDINATFKTIISQTLESDSAKTYYQNDSISLQIDRLLDDGTTDTVYVDPYNMSVVSSNSSVVRVNYSSLSIIGSGESNISVILDSGDVITKEIVIHEYPEFELNSTTLGKNIASSQILYYKFDLNETTLFDMHLSSSENANFAIYNSNFSYLESASGSDVNLSKVLSSGTYYVGVQAYYSSNELSDYNITSSLKALQGIALNIENSVTLKQSIDYNVTMVFEDDFNKTIAFDSNIFTLSISDSNIVSSSYNGTLVAQNIGEANLSISLNREFENNVTIIVNDAKSLPSIVNGNGVNYNEMNYYRVDLNTTGLYNLHINSSNYVYAYIYDANFNSIVYSVNRDFNISEVLSAGKYYVGIGNYYEATYDLNSTFKKLTAITLNLDKNITLKDVIDLNLTRTFADNSSDIITIYPNEYNVTSSNATVVNVAYSSIEAKSVGEANLTITAYDGFHDSVELKVNGIATIDFNQTILSETIEASQYNYYAVDVNQSGTLDVNINTIGNNDYLYAYLYDANFSQISYASGNGDLLHMQLDAGKYYIGVRGYYNSTTYDITANFH